MSLVFPCLNGATTQVIAPYKVYLLFYLLLFAFPVTEIRGGICYVAFFLEYLLHIVPCTPAIVCKMQSVPEEVFAFKSPWKIDKDYWVIVLLSVWIEQQTRCRGILSRLFGINSHAKETKKCELHKYCRSPLGIGGSLTRGQNPFEHQASVSHFLNFTPDRRCKMNPTGGYLRETISKLFNSDCIPAW